MTTVATASTAAADAPPLLKPLLNPLPPRLLPCGTRALTALHLYWCAILAGYGAKVLWPALDAWTSYGKLAPRGRDSEHAFAVAAHDNDDDDGCSSRRRRHCSPMRALASRVLQWRRRLALPHGAGFTLFYALGAPWCAGVAFACAATPSDSSRSAPPFLSRAAALAPLLLLEVQLVRRLLECRAVHRFSRRRMPPDLFAFGLSFYMAAPWSLACATGACGERYRPCGWRWSWSLQQTTTATNAADVYAVSMVVVAAVVAMAVFVLASAAQHVAHRQLAAARDNGDAARRGGGGGGGGGKHLRDCGARQRPRYRVLHRGMFAYVACPHYTAEVLIYASMVTLAVSLRPLAHAASSSDGAAAAAAVRPALLMFAFVLANLTHAARRTRHWYMHGAPFRRGEYPPSRKAIVPRLL